MKETRLTGKIEFCDKDLQEYDRKFIAILTESGAFQYGNGTMVVIEWDAMKNRIIPEPELIDTRYDVKIHRDGSNFKQWLTDYFTENYAKHILTID